MSFRSCSVVFLVVLVLGAEGATSEDSTEAQYHGGDATGAQEDLKSGASMGNNQTGIQEKKVQDVLSIHGYVEGDDVTVTDHVEALDGVTHAYQRSASSRPSCQLLDTMYDDIQDLKTALPSVLLPCEAGPFGGNGGREFTDKAWVRYGQIYKIELWINTTKGELTGLRTYYKSTSYKTSLWGSTTGSRLYTVTFLTGEYITKVEGTVKSYAWHNEHTYIVSALRYTTSRGRVYGWFGNAAHGIAFKAEGGQLLYMTGKYGSRIDHLNFHFDKCKIKAH